jgi:YcxB-like protein
MQFEYEIPLEEYVSAQTLYNKMGVKAQPLKRGIGWIIIGLFFAINGLLPSGVGWDSFLLLITGLYFVYCGVVMLFPRNHYRRYYRSCYAESGLAGNLYHAEVDKKGFQVQGNGCSWQLLWSELQSKAEDESVFMLNGKGTVFIFGKRYLSDEQQEELRKFASMS